MHGDDLLPLYEDAWSHSPLHNAIDTFFVAPMEPQTNARRRGKRKTASSTGGIPLRRSKVALTYELVVRLMAILFGMPTLLIGVLATTLKLSIPATYRAIRLAHLLHHKLISKSDFYNGQKNARKLTSEQGNWFADLVR